LTISAHNPVDIIPLLALDIFAYELKTHNIFEIEFKRLSSSPAEASRIIF
jgi:hypothetical protein